MRENILKGINVAFILIISSILTLRLTNDFNGMKLLFDYFIPVLLVYIIVGVIFQVFRNNPAKINKGSSGIAIYYWVSMVMIIIPVIGMFLSDYIRYIILVNVIVIITLWIFDYINLSNIAKELNEGKAIKQKTLVIDLKTRPNTKDEFFRILEDHCLGNGEVLEYIERDIPAIIKIDGILYRAEVGYYYALAGNLVYTLKITEF